MATKIKAVGLGFNSTMGDILLHLSCT